MLRAALDVSQYEVMLLIKPPVQKRHSGKSRLFPYVMEPSCTANSHPRLSIARCRASKDTDQICRVGSTAGSCFTDLFWAQVDSD